LHSYDKDWAAWLRQAHFSILEIAKELNLKYLDLHDAYKETGYAILKEKKEDIVHPNRYGHFIASKELIRKFYSYLGLSKKEADSIVQMRFSEYKNRCLVH
jgi:hypothetical protein